ncbi:hypothetical protein [Rosenbergiella epipactidis]|uniref:hypothetical protein n=1 Tax=Rosenbergiella epipactidis TaxID=1544694 RepID=UPI001F4D919A|nr:hypothetical protein [Rosenbergiella epipactidis]
MASKGDFFTIDKSVFMTACGLSLNAGIAYVIMACGSQGNNRTTAWSVQAVSKYADITRMRAERAIKELESAELARKIKAGSKPLYILAQSPEQTEEDKIYLPNSIVTGVGEEEPPIQRLRQMRDTTYLMVFCLLYYIQDLENYGGMPLEMLGTENIDVETLFRGDVINVHWVRSTTYKIRSPWYSSSVFNYYGIDFNDFSEVFFDLRRDGLLKVWGVVFESSEYDAEEVGYGLDYSSVAELDKQSRIKVKNLRKWPESGTYMAVSRRIKQPVIKAVARMHYRPHTGKTARWFARDERKKDKAREQIDKQLSIEVAKAKERLSK